MTPRPDESPEALFKRALQMEATLARKLIGGGISTLEELAYVPIGELLQVPGLDESEAQHIRKRARQYLIGDALRDQDRGSKGGD
jgi:transcription termination/antitermination protein NusA